MARRGLAGRHRRRFKKTTIADERAAASPDLVQRSFAAGQVLDSTWVGDITYLRTWEGWAYLATVIDLGSRRVVGFAVADHMRSSLVEEAMEMAVLSRRASRRASSSTPIVAASTRPPPFATCSTGTASASR